MCVAVIVGMDSSRADVLPALSTLLRHYGYVQSTQANPKKVWFTNLRAIACMQLLLKTLNDTHTYALLCCAGVH